MPENVCHMPPILGWLYPSDTFDPWWIHLAYERNWITEEKRNELMSQEYYEKLSP